MFIFLLTPFDGVKSFEFNKEFYPVEIAPPILP